jgi:hypothetical protein
MDSSEGWFNVLHDESADTPDLCLRACADVDAGNERVLFADAYAR